MTSRILDLTIQIGIVLILIVAPLPFGSVQDRWIFFIEAAVCCLALLWVASQITAGEIRLAESRLAWPLLAVAAYILLTFFPIPAGILSVISPEAARAYRAAARVISAAPSAVPPEFRITVDPYETEGELLKFLAYSAFFFLMLSTLRRRREFLAAYSILIAMGTALAALGIAQSVWSNGRIYWRYESGSGTPFGPFVNHNHFAAYVELALGLCIGMLLAEVAEFRRKNNPTGSAGYVSWLWHKDGGLAWLLLSSLFVMLASLAASLSRGGLLSFVTTCVAFGSAALFFPRRRRAGPTRPNGQRNLLALAALTAILAWAGLIILTPLGNARWLGAPDKAAMSRIEILRDSGRAVSDFPLTGAGLGSFRSIFPRYKSGNFNSETTHAENEYMQWAVETGAVGFGLMLLAALAFWRRVLSRLKERHDPYFRLLACGALFGVTSLGIHNCFDFNTHIPSNSIMLAAVAALSLIAVRTHRGNAQEDRRPLSL